MSCDHTVGTIAVARLAVVVFKWFIVCYMHAAFGHACTFNLFELLKLWSPKKPNFLWKKYYCDCLFCKRMKSFISIMKHIKFATLRITKNIQFLSCPINDFYISKCKNHKNHRYSFLFISDLFCMWTIRLPTWVCDGISSDITWYSDV